jgi:hypothetical protein
MIEAASTPQPPPATLFTPNQIAGATFLGGPIAGAVLAYKNFRALNQPDKARNVLLAGIGITVVVMVIAALLPTNMPNSVLPIVYTFSARSYAQQAFVVGKPVFTPGKTSTAVGIGFASLAGMLVVIFGTIAVLEVAGPTSVLDRLNDSVTVAPHKTVFFEKGATAEDARILGQSLKAIGLFVSDNDMDIKLSGKSGHRAISFVINGDENDTRTIAAFNDVGRRIEKATFPGESIEIRLCDDMWQVKRTLRFDAQSAGENSANP